LSQESAAARVVIPPRPNLGPEPWSEQRPEPFPLAEVTFATAALLLVMVLAAAWRRRRRTTRLRTASASPLALPSGGDPSARLVILAGQARETLAARFGPSLRARTTEEIAADPRLRESLGDSHFVPIVRLLATADRWKFAPLPKGPLGESAFEDLSRWEECCRTLSAVTPLAERPKP
jgi:hypothetical protein